MKEREFKVNLQLFADEEKTEEGKQEVDIEKIVAEKVAETIKVYEEKVNKANEELANERLRVRDLELASKSEADKAKFLQEEAEKLKEAKLKAIEDELKVYKEREGKTAFENSLLKLKNENPHLVEELEDVTNYEELNAFLKIKPKLDKKYNELKVFREANAKSGINAMSGIKNTSDDKIANIEFAKQLKASAIADFNKTNKI